MVLRRRTAIAFASIVVSMWHQGSLLVESRSTIAQDSNGRTRYYRGNGFPGASSSSSSSTSTSSSIQRGTTDHQEYGTTKTVRGVRMLGMGRDSDDKSSSMMGGKGSRDASQDDTPSGSPSISLMPSRAPSEAPSGTPSISLAPSVSAAPTTCSMSKKGGSDDKGSSGKRRKLKKSGSSGGEDKSCSDSADRNSGIGALNRVEAVHEMKDPIVFGPQSR